MCRMVERLERRICLAASPAPDSDLDALPDVQEQAVLDQYRPWFYFDAAEVAWPSSATWFTQHSNLLNTTGGTIPQATMMNNPRLALTSSPASGSQLTLDILDANRSGQYAANPSLSSNVPVYGHVVPLSDANAITYPGYSGSFGSGFVLVQYWMLFPFNDSHKFDYIPFTNQPGDHEGDWIWIDLFLNVDGQPQTVVYHHHGDGSVAPSVVDWSQVQKRDGAPIGFPEWGTHELWEAPGGAGGLNSPVEHHWGDGLQIRPSAVVNMGEPSHAMSHADPNEQLDSDLALSFNGIWGDFAGTNADNPPGPAGHSPFPGTPTGSFFANLGRGSVYVNGSDAANSIVVRDGGTTLDVTVTELGQSLALHPTKSPLHELILDGNSGNDTFDVGNLSGTAITHVDVIGDAGTDQLLFTGNASSLPLPGGLNLTFEGGTGDTFTVSGGSYTFGEDASTMSSNLAVVVAPGAAVSFGSGQHLATLNVSGIAAMSPVSAGNAQNALIVKSLIIAASARLDLSNNQLALTYFGSSPIGSFNGSSYTGITGLVTSGRVVSSAAHGTFTRLGVSDSGSSVVVKYTYGGDANLDGKLNIDDYTTGIDSNVGLPGASGWSKGDFNYDGKINIDDYVILDGNLAAQGPPLGSSASAVVSQVTLSIGVPAVTWPHDEARRRTDGVADLLA